MRVAFGDCVFDPGTHEVFRDGRASLLPLKAFTLLDLLISRRPNAVSKEEIHERIWPGTFVSDASVANLVAELRAILGDDARKPKIIRTVHRFGYAFRADVNPAREQSAPLPFDRTSCRILWDGREIHLRDGENVIGREPEAAIWVDDSAVSRRHARIVVGADGAMIEDLGSKNGTKLQGRKIRDAARLKDKDVIQIGPASMVVRVYRRAGTTETAIEDGSSQ
ncbi:MAG TPA: FHA domain-containing protein [Thermoanaerobaculia bacterium]|nr:FHA domain-containing protein [Thermoanaerobaculia bacterium]